MSTQKCISVVTGRGNMLLSWCRGEGTIYLPTDQVIKLDGLSASSRSTRTKVPVQFHAVDGNGGLALVGWAEAVELAPGGKCRFENVRISRNGFFMRYSPFQQTLRTSPSCSAAGSTVRMEGSELHGVVRSPAEEARESAMVTGDGEAPAKHPSNRSRVAMQQSHTSGPVRKLVPRVLIDQPEQILSRNNGCEFCGHTDAPWYAIHAWSHRKGRVSSYSRYEGGFPRQHSTTTAQYSDLANLAGRVCKKCRSQARYSLLAKAGLLLAIAVLFLVGAWCCVSMFRDGRVLLGFIPLLAAGVFGPVAWHTLRQAVFYAGEHAAAKAMRTTLRSLGFADTAAGHLHSNRLKESCNAPGCNDVPGCGSQSWHH